MIYHSCQTNQFVATRTDTSISWRTRVARRRGGSTANLQNNLPIKLNLTKAVNLNRRFGEDTNKSENPKSWEMIKDFRFMFVFRILSLPTITLEGQER